MSFRSEWLDNIIPPREEINPLQEQFDNLATRWNLTILHQMTMNYRSLCEQAKQGDVCLSELGVLAELKGLMIGI